MQGLFSFTHNSETNEVVFAGNINVEDALIILQKIVIDVSTKKALEEIEKNKESK